MQALSLTDQDGNTLAVLHGAAVSEPISGTRRELPQEHRPDGTVEETFRLLLQGAGIRACLTALEEILASSRSGFRPAYLTLQDTADSPVVRTPVLDGCLDGLGAGLEDRRRGAQALRLRITRPDWWEEALVCLPLSNLHGTDQTAGVELRVTSLERTLVDVLERPDLSGSWEEIWRSLETIEFFDLDKVVEYTLLLENSTTAGKVGFFLEQHREPLMVEPRHLEALRARRPRQPHYLDRAKRTSGRLVSEWNLVVPMDVYERTWSEVP